MTHAEAEQIIKEAIEETYKQVYSGFKECDIDFWKVDGQYTIFSLIGKTYTTKSIHWREYFLSHEFCKERWGVADMRWHLKQLVLCTNLLDVAEYLKKNPKNK
jgi:hypothetical protein